jgi:ubiquinone/menaquinone biosynthesis C-methylase UbiE
MGQGRHVVGLDESSQMAVLARQTRALEDTLVALVRGVAQRQPFEAAQFDCVVATFPTEFIFDIHTIGELQRVLRPGGRLIVLPVAWIVGRSWPDRIAAWLLAVTRQVPPAAEQMLEERLLHPLRDAGFLVGLRRLEVQSSIVLLVLASKPPASPFQDPLALQR